ncbi:MAG: ABC transporter substrate-binding protein, partial [Alphaproteobacteria bacterium]|nr:ABC transporter substrate-binding protein [Alphaproteobacteria bacterium]
MSRFSMGLSGTALAVALGASVGFAAGTAGAADTVVMAVPSFLTGAGAPAFGVPSRNGAELMINAINKGKVPAPYNSK